MELSCPSCGTKHRTEDYPGAFEILCSCGYSILVPDLQALSAPPPDPSPGFIAKAPIADEEADRASLIPLNDPEPMPESDAFAAPSPSEDLPAGMVYDPFELPGNEAAPAPEADVNAWATPAVEAEAAPALIEELPEVVEAPKAKAVTPPKLAPAPAPSASPAQTILERSQRASLGQLIGRSYDVRCHTTNRALLAGVAERCRKILKGRPWLESELRRKGIDLDRLPETASLTGAPELLAVEFFLACSEGGGRCEFRRNPDDDPTDDATPTP